MKNVLLFTLILAFFYSCDSNDSSFVSSDNSNTAVNQKKTDSNTNNKSSIDTKSDISVVDSDGDAKPDLDDNCPFTKNSDQSDQDLDGLGDVCDPNPIKGDYTNHPEYKPENENIDISEVADDEEVKLEVIRACTHHGRSGGLEGTHANNCQGPIKFSVEMNGVPVPGVQEDLDANALVALAQPHDSLKLGYLPFTIKGLTISKLRVAATDKLAMYGITTNYLYKVTCLVDGKETFITQTAAGNPITDTELKTGKLALNLYIKKPDAYYMSAIEDKTCDTGYTPLVLDLDGDGFQLSNIENGVSFDVEGVSAFKKTAWTVNKNKGEQDNALLAIDLDGNMVIDSGKELFGQYSKISGVKPANGFIALASYDSHKDGKIDKNDRDFTKLRLWIDKNMDGRSQMDELFLLSDKGVTEINLATTDNNKPDEFGNTLWLKSTFKMSTPQGKNSTNEIADVLFQAE